ncbi:DNA cytosine methyltransferase [Roseivivax marinus]|uniref:DNA cytosine methyltransferase n=1 Tax=Roseivivax marinus TaxID=1379903 RepID=UPI00273D1E6F|nr:DNA cytosine methyltransferase [Roseivivax marinus]
MPTAVSLFSGCGGSDLGLAEAGYDVIMANDVMPYAADFYRCNLPDTDYKLCDIREMISFPKADLLVGCYPCQGFSEGGARDAARPINYLYREFDRALRYIKPKAFIVENVSGMTRANNASLLKNQIVRFRLAGYRVQHKILDAIDFGVPQRRRRLFFVGIRSDIDFKFKFPDGWDGTRRLPGSRTIREALTGMPMWPEEDTYDRQPFHWYYLSRNRRKEWDEASATVVAHSRHVGLHPVSPPLKKEGPDRWRFLRDEPARRFTYQECSRLQGFPHGISFPETGGLKMRYRIIGNAVPPPVFAAVASSLSVAVS